VGSSVYLTAFPVGYIFLMQGYNPVIVFKVLVIVRLIYLFVIIKIVSDYVSFSFRDYFSLVFVPILRVTVPIVLLARWINSFFAQDFLSLLEVVLVFFLMSFLIIYWGGMTSEERLFVRNKILHKR